MKDYFSYIFSKIWNKYFMKYNNYQKPVNYVPHYVEGVPYFGISKIMHKWKSRDFICHRVAYGSCLKTIKVQDCDLYFLIAYTPLSTLIFKEHMICYVLGNYFYLKKETFSTFRHNISAMNQRILKISIDLWNTTKGL